MELSSKKITLPLTALILIAPFFLWGTAMVAVKGVIPHTTPFFMAGIRLVPAGILVLITASILKLPQPQTAKAWLWIECAHQILFHHKQMLEFHESRLT